MQGSPAEYSPLTVTGHGTYDAFIDLDQPPHFRVQRYDDEADALYRAVTVKGAYLEGSMRDGRSIFEVNSYAPPGVVEPDGDRCVLASFEFRSMNLISARGGVLFLRGFLGAAESYGQDVFDRIAAGTALDDLSELESESGGIRYLPPHFEPLQDFLGWEAGIKLVPRRNGQ